MAQRNQVILRDAPGLRSQPSPFVIPAGSLLEAQEVDITREGIYQCRRGFVSIGEGGTLLAKLMHYRDTILWNTTAGGLKFEGGASVGSGWDPPDSSTRMQYQEAAENLYLTTSTGVRVLHATSFTSAHFAGMPMGLDLNLSLSGTGAGWFEADGQLGYRGVFGRVDPNNNDIAGPAGYQETIANPAPIAVTFTYAAGVVTVTQTAHGYTNGDTIDISDVSDAAYEAGPHVITFINANSYSYTVVGAPASPGTGKASKRHTVTLEITLSADLVAGDYVEVYRTRASASDDTPPGDQHYLVKRIILVAGDITAGFVTYVDTLEEALLTGQPQLESNPSVNGPSQAPARPPWARYLALWQGHMWYGHTRQQHSRTIQFLDIAGLVDDTSSITVDYTDATDKTFTFSTAENQAARKFKRWTTATTLAENVRRTMQSLVKILNRDHGDVEAYYISATNEAPGKILIRRRAFNKASFALKADLTTTGDNFDPALPASGTSISSDEDYRRNGLYVSRAGRPEAVPFANGLRVGSDLDDILGLAATSSALLVFSKGGTFMVTGQTDGGAGKSFTVDELDLNMKLMAPETLRTLNDFAYGLFTQGVCRISASGSAIMSEGHIGDKTKELVILSNIATVAHAVSYESEHKYILCAPSSSSDTVANRLWVYNDLLNRWFGPWLRTTTTAVVLRSLDHLYMARSNTGTEDIVKQRRFDPANDFADEVHSVTINGAVYAQVAATDPYSGTVTKVFFAVSTLAHSPQIGWRFTYNAVNARICIVEFLGGFNFAVTLDRDFESTIIGLPVGTGASIWRVIDWQVKYALDGGNAASLKQANEVQAYFERPQPSVLEFGFQADDISDVDFNPAFLLPAAGNGNQSDPMREKVPLDHQRHRVLYLTLRHRTVGEDVKLLQVSEDVRTISTVTRR